MDGKEVTFGEALTWAIRIAQYFKSKGLGHKDIIGVSMRYSKYSMALGVACLMNATPFHSITNLLDEGKVDY